MLKVIDRTHREHSSRGIYTALLQYKNSAFIKMGVELPSFTLHRNALRSGTFFRHFIIDSVPSFAHKFCRHTPSLAESPTTLSTILEGFIRRGTPSYGIVFHSLIVKCGLQFHALLCGKLLTSYLKAGCLCHAQQMFNEIPQRTVSSWNAMIATFFKEGQPRKSLKFLSQMRSSGEKFDGFTYSSILKLSGGLRYLNLGRQAHCQILRCNLDSDHILITGLIDMYIKNGKIHSARLLFDESPDKNVVCSTAMISGYMKSGRIQDAEVIFEATVERDTVVWNAMVEGYSLQLVTASRALFAFINMQRSGLHPTVSTFASVIGACISLSALKQGHQIHSHAIKSDCCKDVRIGSALVDMYAKCGRIEDARKVFEGLHHRNVITWTAMIDGYGKNGNVNESLRLFDRMKKMRITPNYVTFLSLLSACGHGGLVSEGWEIFNSMRLDYNLPPRMEHYACMVDLIGKAGSLENALNLIKGMPIRPNDDVWGALLGVSRLHGNVGMAALAAEELFKLNSGRPGAYVALSNAYAAAGRWEGVQEVRDLMKDVQKNAGCSWVETGEGLLAFHVGGG